MASSSSFSQHYTCCSEQDAPDVQITLKNSH